MKALDENTERARLICKLLDKYEPIPKDAPRDIRERMDVERQVLVMRLGWNRMPVEQLRDALEGS